MKLIRIERSIHVYSNKKSNELIREYKIDNVDVNILKKIVNASNDDPEVYDGYELNEEQIIIFNELLTEKIQIDFKKYYYVLESIGIYDYNKSKTK